jgi:hypothetical protein
VREQSARKTKTEAAGSAGDQVMFHGEDNSRGKKRSAMSQSIDRNGREERKETTDRKCCKFHRGDLRGYAAASAGCRRGIGLTHARAAITEHSEEDRECG